MEEIIYEDSHVILVHKPGGISVQTRRMGEKDMVSILKNYRANKGEQPYIGVIHRIDQPVEGLLLFAKTKEAAVKLSGQFQKRGINKIYRAIVINEKGVAFSIGKEVSLCHYLLKDGRTNLSEPVKEGTPGAKKAILQPEERLRCAPRRFLFYIPKPEKRCILKYGLKIQFSSCCNICRLFLCAASFCPA